MIGGERIRSKVQTSRYVLGGRLDFSILLKLIRLNVLAASTDRCRPCIPPTAVANTSKIDAWLQILVLLERGLIIRI